MTLICLSIATLLLLHTFRENIIFFYTPKDLLGLAFEDGDRRLRLGGLVEEGSIVRSDDGLEIVFTVKDESHRVLVTFTGLLPDLFRENQGVIAEGFLRDGIFVADTVLAKHDERYMPSEVAREMGYPTVGVGER